MVREIEIMPGTSMAAAMIRAVDEVCIRKETVQFKFNDLKITVEKIVGDIKYRGYTIRHDPPGIPIRAFDWQYWADDYDGPEDGRCGTADSLDDAKRQIDEWIGS